MGKKIAHLSTDGWQKMLIPELEKLGYTVLDNDCDRDVDVVLVKSVIKMGDSIKIRRMFPKIPVIEYVWDVYSWALETPRPNEYDYDSYKKLCEESLEVWVPSRAVQNSLKDNWGMDSLVFKSYFPVKPYDKPFDRGYAFQGLRINPDRHMDWFERACKETGIPYKMTNPDFPMEEQEYRETLSGARMYVSPIYEMSTGGMFLFEGAMWEKPILVSNSKYMGAIDYFGDSIAYFQWDDFEDLKDKLTKVYTGEIKTNTKKAKSLVEAMTVEDFALRVDKRLQEIL